MVVIYTNYLKCLLSALSSMYNIYYYYYCMCIYLEMQSRGTDYFSTVVQLNITITVSVTVSCTLETR